MKHSIPYLLELAIQDQTINSEQQILNDKFSIRILMISLFNLVERWDRLTKNIIIHPSLKNYLCTIKEVEYVSNPEIFSKPKFLLWGTEIIFNKDVPTDHIIVVAEAEIDTFGPECIAIGLVNFDLIERVKKLQAFI